MKSTTSRTLFVAALLALCGAAYAGIPGAAELVAGLGLIGFVGNTELLMKELDKIESALSAVATKADLEAKLGEVSADTKAQIEGLGTKQRELADRLLTLEQKGTAQNDTTTDELTSWGKQFIKSDVYTGHLGQITKGIKMGSVGFEVKNTVIGSDTTVAPARQPGVVPGASQPLTLESLYRSVPTTSNAIEFTKENVFTNNAAEAAEGATRAESSITFTLVNMPVSNVGHWIKISRQLAADNTALSAYIDLRMRYGVNRKVETQLAAGNGVSPNLSGFMTAGNYVAHGYADAALGTVLKKLVLIRKVIGDLEAAGYNPDAIVLNPADWAQIEIDIFTAGSANVIAFGYDTGGRPLLFGRRVVTSVGMTADTFAVGAFNEAGTIHNRENVIVEMSDSDGDNFTKGLITLRAERRLALASEVPAAIRGGDLTPA